MSELFGGDYENLGNELGTDLPDISGLPWKISSYRILAMPIAPPVKTAGGLILPEEAKTFHKYNNRIAQCIACGPSVGKHPKYEKLGVPKDFFPVRGDYFRFTNAMDRHEWNGVNLIMLNDDQILINYGQEFPKGLGAFDHGKLTK